MSHFFDSDQVTYSGYDYEFVGTIPSKYICSICTKVLRDAHLTDCCGQHFCASCLTHWLGTQQRRKTCPHCQQRNFQHIVNKAMIREVNEFKIHCTNHREGCGWVGELGGLKRHLDSDKGCGYVEVTCTNRRCGERMSRKNLQTHLQEMCYYRPYECEHCGHKNTYTAITGKQKKGFMLVQSHYLKCPEFPLACPNRCGVTGIRRRAMPDHHSSCPLEPLHCPLEGCGERVNRKDLQTHLQEECYYRPYECEHCGHKDTYTAITGKQVQKKAVQSHYSECPEYPLACPNRCGVTGIRRRAMPDHHSTCPLEPLDCPFKGCKEKMNRKDLQPHMQEKCYYRPYKCEYCGHKDTYTAITGKNYVKVENHYSECPEYPLACPNRCGVTGIRRRAMPDHHSSCPLEPLDCPFKDAGCTEKIARKDMEDHMTANQQKHILLTFQSLRQSNQQVTDTKRQLDDTKREFDDTKRQLDDTKRELCATKQDLHTALQNVLQLCKIGDTLTFQVSDFPQLGKEKKAWHSPPFSIGANLTVRLAVYPSGVGRGQRSYISVSLILKEVVKKEEDMDLEYNVSVAAIGEHRAATSKTLELCTGDYYFCSAFFPLPSPGEVLRSEEQFLEIEEANSLLQNDAVTLKLKLLEHHHQWW